MVDSVQRFCPRLCRLERTTVFVLCYVDLSFWYNIGLLWIMTRWFVHVAKEKPQVWTSENDLKSFVCEDKWSQKMSILKGRLLSHSGPKIIYETSGHWIYIFNDHSFYYYALACNWPIPRIRPLNHLLNDWSLNIYIQWPLVLLLYFGFVTGLPQTRPWNHLWNEWSLNLYIQWPLALFLYFGL